MPDEGEFCGNFRVEGDEQCDGGPEGDQCCTRDCEFHPGAICRYYKLTNVWVDERMC